MKKQILYIIGCSALLSSCHIYSNYERPQNIVSDSLYRDTTAAPMLSWLPIRQTSVICLGKKSFSNPQLQALINKALVQNADIRTADLTIQQAEAALKVSRLAYLPALNFVPSGNRQQLRRCQSHSDLFTSRSGKLANRRFWLGSQPEETI